MPGEPWEEAMPGLEHSARELMTGPPIYLNLEKAEILLAQFQETATHRKWTLRAVAIMAEHYKQRGLFDMHYLQLRDETSEPASVNVLPASGVNCQS